MTKRNHNMDLWSAAHVSSDRKGGARPWGFRDAAVAEAIGKEIRRVRLERGLSQYDLAAMVRVSQPQIIHYEKGRESTSLAVLLDLEEALHLRRGYFFRIALEAVECAERVFMGRRGGSSKEM
jgi:ribosome-binding protein aMBF1 (putative translation factor)